MTLAELKLNTINSYISKLPDGQRIELKKLVTRLELVLLQYPAEIHEIALSKVLFKCETAKEQEVKD